MIATLVATMDPYSALEASPEGRRALDDALAQIVQRRMLPAELVARVQAEGVQRLRGKAGLLAELGDRLARGRLTYATTFFISNLRPINEIYGFAIGDLLQALVARVLEVVLRELDEEAAFGQPMGKQRIVLHATTSRDLGERIARRMVDAVFAAVLESAARTLRPRPVVATVAVPPRAGVDDVLNMVALAARRAERGGGEPLFLGEQAEQTQALVRLRERESGVNLVTRALSESRIDVYYQPVIDLSTGRLFDAEALARIRSGDGVVAAHDFIDAIYDLGEVVELDTQVFRRVVRDAARLATVTGRLFVNVSPVSLASPAFLAVLREALDGQRASSGLEVVLELTEQALLQHTGTIREIHRELGVVFAVDDFGTGYSSLKTVADLAVSGVVSYLKLDGSLTRQAAVSEEVYKVVLATVNMARSLGLQVIAEHVEDAAVLDRLRTTGVELAQGEVFAPALPLHALLERYGGGAVEPVPSLSPAAIAQLEPYVDTAFAAFSSALLSNRHFSEYFSGREQVLALVERQRETFRRSLHDAPEALRRRYARLGHLHHDLLVPYATAIKGADLLAEKLMDVVAHVNDEGALVRATLAFFAQVKRSMARGYLERILTEDREVHEVLRARVAEGWGEATADELFSCLARLVDAIENDRPRLLPPADSRACRLTARLHPHAGERDPEAAQLAHLHRAYHLACGNIAFFLEQADYGSVLLLYRKATGAFLTLTNLLLLGRTGPLPGGRLPLRPRGNGDDRRLS